MNVYSQLYWKVEKLRKEACIGTFLKNYLLKLIEINCKIWAYKKLPFCVHWCSANKYCKYYILSYCLKKVNVDWRLGANWLFANYVKSPLTFIRNRHRQESRKFCGQFLCLPCPSQSRIKSFKISLLIHIQKGGLGQTIHSKTCLGQF